jgi:hypothetical protein
MQNISRYSVNKRVINPLFSVVFGVNYDFQYYGTLSEPDNDSYLTRYILNNSYPVR